jgi:hypothetical protein
MGQILTVNDVIMCPHGGTVTLSSSQSRASAGGGLILRPGDTFTVTGCALTIPSGPHPCVVVEWQNPSAKAKAGGTGVLTTSSIGICKAGDQAPQGTALIQKTQTGASAR